MSDPSSSSPEPTTVESPPELPEGLELVRALGQGRMARVYLAREAELDRMVAVKVLRADRTTDEEARLRFEREARAAASLTDANVVPVHRFGRLGDGTPYLVMTHVRGRTLTDQIQANGLLSEVETKNLLRQLASGLAAAHRKGIVHRDVRPSNVLVDEESGRYLLADFGLAALLDLPAGGKGGITRTGQILGDPRYASPEQLQGHKVTEQADVYSLGVLAYEVLTGQDPYRSTSKQAAVAAHLTAQPRPVSQLRQGVSADLESLLLRCMAREPSHRPRAQDIVKALDVRAGPAGERGDGPEGLGIVRRRIPQIVSLTFAAGIGLLGMVINLIGIGELPAIAYELTVNLIVWGLLASGVLAWYHGERGKQKAPVSEKWILSALAAGWIVATWWLLRG